MKGILSVLIVEDSEDDAELIVRELERGGYELDWKRTQTAVDMAAALNSRQWDIVLSDYDMPVFSAMASLEILKSSGIDIPFIVVSGKIGEEIAVEAMKAGANDYVMKDNLIRLCPAIERELREADIRRERIKAEQELQRSQQNLAKAQEIAQLGSWEWDIVNNAIYWSDEMYRIHGFSKDIIPSQELVRAMVHPDDLEIFDGAMQQAFNSDSPDPIQYRIVLGNGDTRFVNGRAEIRYDELGKLSWMLGTVQDVTELVEVQEEASRTRALEELEVMRNALWASVSHEIRTPLTSIKGLASSLIMNDVEWDDDTRKDFLMNIDKEADRLVRIINDVMDVTRIEAGAMRMNIEQMNLKDIVTPIAERLNSLVTKHIMEMNIPNDLPLVFADELRIGQVITNLVENAVFYSQANTKIAVKAEVVDSNIIASVSDQGCGIEANSIDKVFDRFYRLEDGVKRRREGTGLGLAICKAILDTHGGDIWVTSEVGVGSVFYFSLPIAPNVDTEHEPNVEEKTNVQ